MRNLAVCCLAALVTTAGAQDDYLGEPEKPVARARQLRAKADKALAIAEPALEALRNRQEPSPEAATAAVPALEDAVFHLERSLEVEWSRAANEKLVVAVKAWFKLREIAPANPANPGDEEAEKKARKAKERMHRELLRDVRRMVMDYGKARAYHRLYQRCDRCDGRKDLYNPLDKQKIPCPKCRREGALLVAKNLIRGQWLVRSPIYRADGRNTGSFIRRITGAKTRPEVLAPFVKSLAIQGKIEDHDTWVRVVVKEKIHKEPFAKRTEKVDRVYRFYRVGRIWYLYTQRYDRVVLDLPEEEEEG